MNRRIHTAINVENLSKQYHLGLTHAGSVRELVNGLASSFKRGVRLSSRSDKVSTQSDNNGFIWALEGISFEVMQGEAVGIIGRNGAGKSTLLKILSRITNPTSGCIEMRGRVASLLEVGTGFHPELTGRENVFMNGTILGMTRKEIERNFDSIVDFAEIEKFIDTPVKRYSSGMIVRLGFSVAAHMTPEILIVDEVLAVGDANFQKRCMGKMDEVAKTGRTVLFVSHNMSMIRTLCERALLIDEGKLVCDGSADDVTDIYLTNAQGTEGSKSELSEGFIFQQVSTDTQLRQEITAIQTLDKESNPLRAFGTWDFVKFRIHFSSTELVSKAGVELLIQTTQGVSLIRCSTAPDSGIQYCLKPGNHYVDCIFPKFPLAQGTYQVGGVIAIPKTKPLYRRDKLCEINVLGRNVLPSKRSPEAKRAIVACEHYWQIPGENE